MADYVAMLFEGAIIAYGTCEEIKASTNPDRAAIFARQRSGTDSDLMGGGRVVRGRAK